MINGKTFIAEVKTVSPFGFKAEESWLSLLNLADRNGDWISIHTDPRWGGSIPLLKQARKLAKKPILAKGIHETDDDIQRALDAGAAAVLVVGRMPADKYLDKCWLEPLTVAEMQAYPTGTKVVWNSRDLTTGEPKKENIVMAREAWSGWLCQASNIRSVEHIRSYADAVLVGQHLREFIKTFGK